MGAWGGEHGSMGSMGTGAWEHGEGHCRLLRRRAGAHRHRRRPPIGDKARSRSSDRLAAVIAVGWVVVAMVKAVRVLVVRVVVVVVVVVCSQRRTASRLPSGAVPSAMEMARVAAAKEGGGGEGSGDQSGDGEGGEGAGGGGGGGSGGSSQRRTAARLPSGAVPSAMEMARASHQPAARVAGGWRRDTLDAQCRGPREAHAHG